MMSALDPSTNEDRCSLVKGLKQCMLSLGSTVGQEIFCSEQIFMFFAVVL